MSDSVHEIKFEPGEEHCADVLGPTLVTLQSGLLEYYGTPLEESVEYYFAAGTTLLLRAPKTAVSEAIAIINGKVAPHIETKSCVYSATMTRFNEYLNCIRADVEQTAASGPSVLVCGPRDFGKDMFCRVLCNAAIESDHHVKYIDLNTETNSITFPRHIGAVTVEDFLPPGNFIDNASQQVYSFDYDQPLEHSNSYAWRYLLKICREIHKACCEEMAKSKNLRCGGVVINAPDELFPHEEFDTAHPLLAELVEAFDIRYVCIVGQGEHVQKNAQKLKSAPLLRERCIFQHFPFVCRKTSVLPSAVDRRDGLISNYFMGADFQLQCFKIGFNYDMLHFFRVNSESVTVSDNTEESCVSNLVAINFSEEYDEYIGRIASLTDAQSSEDISTARVLGFFVISSVDRKNGKVYLVSPTPESLNYNHFILTQATTRIPELLCS